MKQLIEGNLVVVEKEELKRYVTFFTKKMFGSKGDPKIKLHIDTWKDTSQVTNEENHELTKPFTIYGGSRRCQLDQTV
jgi:hypothetical protein